VNVNDGCIKTLEQKNSYVKLVKYLAPQILSLNLIGLKSNLKNIIENDCIKARLSNLVHLIVSGCKLFDDLTMKYVCFSCSLIKSLNISDTKISSRSLHTIS
ncbi:MAG: hypothetical protein MHPSP_004556, partial [Paramarteilia canceri]